MHGLKKPAQRLTTTDGFAWTQEADSTAYNYGRFCMDSRSRLNGLQLRTVLHGLKKPAQRLTTTDGFAKKDAKF